MSITGSLILAGDIGGTKTLLQVVHHTPQGQEIVQQQRYDSAAYASFDDVLRIFLGSLSAGTAIDAACIGVAGPVQRHPGNQTAQVTNLPWRLDVSALTQHFPISRLRLINDFQAIGFGIDSLDETHRLCLHEGTAVPHAPRAVIGAGTGLGQAILVWREAGTVAGTDSGVPVTNGFYDVLPGEGGHADFGPGDEEQRALVNYLAATHARVTTETVLSGRGLVNAYRFFTERYPAKARSQVAAAMAQGDAATAVSRAALEEHDPLASRALDLFVRIYGTQAGNLALTCMALGGVYIAGGIAPKIEPALRQGGFMAAFLDKAPMQAVMQRIPVYLVRDSELGLKGAAQAALRLTQDAAC